MTVGKSGAFENPVQGAVVNEFAPASGAEGGDDRNRGDDAHEERGGEAEKKHGDENDGGGVEEEGKVLVGGVQVSRDLDLEATVHCAQIVHIGRSYRLAALVTLFFALALLICGVGGAGFVAGACLFYPVAVAASFFLYSRWGSRMGAPLEMTPAGLVFAGMSAVLLLSGQLVAGLLAGGAAMLLSGWSAGAWLAVLAVDRGLSFLEAVREVRRLERAARAASWLAAVAGLRWEVGLARSGRGGEW